MEPCQVVEDVLDRGEVDLYGDDAEFYDLMYSSETSLQNKEHSVRRNVPEGSKLLDLGCGTGTAIERLEEDYDVTGADISREMLEVADRKGLEADLVQADMRSLPYEEEFDAVVMHGHPLSHLESFRDIDRTLRSAYRALGDNGVLVADYLTDSIGNVASMGTTERDLCEYRVRMTPEFSNYNPATHAADCSVRFEIKNGEEVETVNHESRMKGFHPEQLRHMLEEAGFDKVRDQRFYFSDIQQGVRAEKGEPERKTSLGFDL